jgi:SAM-dependent methyltransferase
MLPPGEAPVYDRRLRDDLLSQATRLFLLGRAVDAGVLARLDPRELPGLLEAGGGFVRSTLAIQPWRDLLVLHDWSGGDTGEDHVVPVSSISGLLADLTVRRPVERALDLGTGSGVQSLLAARHAGRVVAVDVNPRALLLAEWTLALNGVDNVELRHGDLFQPVEGDAFDLVVANPPFIVSPERRWLYRDGVQGSAISQAVVEAAPSFLRDGGFAHVLCQWPLATGEPWDAKGRSWTAGRGCDVWLLRVMPDANLVDYAAGWNSPLRDTDQPGFEAALDRWLDWFASEEIDSVAFALVTLRKRGGDNWVRTDEVKEWPADPTGEHVARIFEGQTLVADMMDRELLDLVLEPAEGFRIDETRAWRDGGFELVAAQPRLAAGVAVRPRLSRRLVEILLQLDGRRSLRDLTSADEAAKLRELVALGFLCVRPDPGSA